MQKTNLLDNSNLKINIKEKLLGEFGKPIFTNRIFINRQFLINNSNKYEFNKESWIQNPQNFALEVYGEFEYYRVVLLINGIGSYTQFKPEKLKTTYILAPIAKYIERIL